MSFNCLFVQAPKIFPLSRVLENHVKNKRRVLENHVKNKKNAKTTICFLYGNGHTVQRMPGFVKHLGR